MLKFISKHKEDWTKQLHSWIQSTNVTLEKVTNAKQNARDIKCSHHNRYTLTV